MARCPSKYDQDMKARAVRLVRCSVERLMQAHGWQGARRRKKVRTTVAGPTAQRAPGLVDRRTGDRHPQFDGSADT